VSKINKIIWVCTWIIWHSNISVIIWRDF
jgi:hypothetical protein